MPQLDHRAPPARRRRGRPVGSDSAETRQHILQAARQVIVERGYQAATFQAIALTAELSRPTLHYYFANREEIYQSLVAEASTVVSEWISRAQRHQTLVAQLSELVAAIADADLRDRSTTAFLVSARLEATRNPELHYDGTVELRAFVRTLITDAAARGELRDGVDVDAVVNMVSSMLWGIGVYAGFVTDGADMASITRQLSGLFAHGLLSHVPVS